jgi:ubiquinone/menaquinone biosynthesis C-methylase UbiE
MPIENRPVVVKQRDEQIYEPRFVTSLFDEMSATYGITNYISSFGFCERWRRQAIEGTKLQPGMLVVDLMTGMGECWKFIRRQVKGLGRIIVIDLSTEMIRRARRNQSWFPDVSIDIEHGDALHSRVTDAQADCVIACFGLKTLSQSQIGVLSAEVWRMLKPGGSFSFVEIAVPSGWLLRIPYLLYLRYAIPLLGRLFLGNPANYRMLAIYTELFSKGDAAVTCLERCGFRVNVQDLFFGCARRISGEKPRHADAA